jgi:uncharacterized protein (TIGR02145 family)
MTAVGGSSTAGKHLKATSGWNRGGNGEDTYGFSALPGGCLKFSGDISSFIGVGNYGYWWSSSEYGNAGYFAYYRYMVFNYDDAYYEVNGKSDLFSVRCVKD